MVFLFICRSYASQHDVPTTVYETLFSVF